MEGKTAQGFNQEIREKTKATDKEKLVSDNGLSNHETEPGHSRMDKLFQNRQYEEHLKANRRASANKNENCHMEAVEDKRETPLGIEETRSTHMDGEAVSGIRKPLSSGRKDHRPASHK